LKRISKSPKELYLLVFLDLDNAQSFKLLDRAKDLTDNNTYSSSGNLHVGGFWLELLAALF